MSITVQSFESLMYLAIRAKLKTDVPDVKWIDQDLGQLDWYAPGTRPMVQWPCVMVDFLEADADDLPENYQTLNCNIQLRLGFAPFSSANSVSPDISTEKALQYYEIEQKIYAALQGWTPTINDIELAQPLSRRKKRTEKREDPFRVRTFIFTTSYQDDSAVTGTRQEWPVIDLDAQIEN